MTSSRPSASARVRGVRRRIAAGAVAAFAAAWIAVAGGGRDTEATTAATASTDSIAPTVVTVPGDPGKSATTDLPSVTTGQS